MPNTQTIDVSHLDGITAAYQISGRIDHSKPTLVLVNSFCTSSELYADVLKTPKVTSVMNLLAIELLGHGQTRAHKTENWTYWDTAIMNLQVMRALGVEKAFVLGTSQGGWVTVRMALLRPDMILGIIPLGTSLDFESDRSRALGCWHAVDSLGHLVKNDFSPSLTSESFTPSPSFTSFLLSSGFGASIPESTRTFWTQELAANYSGEEGRKRIRMAAINLRDRDGLHLRAGDVKCPVLWLHGTEDAVYSVANAKEEIELFTGSPDARLEIIQGGQHFLSASHPDEVFGFVVEFVRRYGRAKL